MILPCYLAMTAAEFDSAAQLPEKPAWMACHFSCYGTGLSNLPRTLPKGSMLIVNDRTPVAGHDPKQIAQQLQQLVEELEIERVLLDLQRPDCEETVKIVAAVTEALSCPTGVAAPYVKGLECPVFLAPPPLHVPLEEYLSPWKEREIWMELMPDAEELTVTRDGCLIRPLTYAQLEEPIHEHEGLCCRYHIQVLEDRAIFTLARSKELLPSFLAQAKELGVTCAVGLYQQLKLPED